MASFSVVSNVSAQNAQANLNTTNIGLQKALTRLSSGFRINMAGDDAAGLAVANAYRSQQAVLNQGIRNANDGLSTLQIKNGALDNISTLLDRMATLASQSASAGFTGNRATLKAEFADVISEISREVTVAGLGTAAGLLGVRQLGRQRHRGRHDRRGRHHHARHRVAQRRHRGGAATAVGAITTAVATVGTVVGTIGSLQNRLQYAIGLAQYQVVNTKAAESRIRDANIAEESTNLTRYNILTQSGLAALAQANQQSSAVLGLLR